MGTKRAPHPKHRISKSQLRLAEHVIALLEHAKDLINDPATPDATVQKIGAILEAYRYRRPPFTPRPKSLKL